MCSGTPTRREPGKFDFTGNNDLRHFIELCAKNGMKVILRPGPYVCAEWDMGGLPWWLLKDRDMKLRDDNPAFMETTPFGAWHGISLRPLVPIRPAITINGSAFCNSIDIQRLGDTNTASRFLLCKKTFRAASPKGFFGETALNLSPEPKDSA